MNDSTDSEEDKLIFNEKEIPIKAKGKITLPKITPEIMKIKDNHHPNTTSSQYEVLFLS